MHRVWVRQYQNNNAEGWQQRIPGRYLWFMWKNGRGEFNQHSDAHQWSSHRLFLRCMYQNMCRTRVCTCSGVQEQIIVQLVLFQWKYVLVVAYLILCKSCVPKRDLCSQYMTRYLQLVNELLECANSIRSYKSVDIWSRRVDDMVMLRLAAPIFTLIIHVTETAHAPSIRILDPNSLRQMHQMHLVHFAYVK